MNTNVGYPDSAELIFRVKFINQKLTTMKLKRFLFPLALLALMSGCVVCSFYPIYTPDDLFVNDLLLGNYCTDNLESDSASWHFEFKTKKVDGEKVADSLRYKLTINENEDDIMDSEFDVHLIRINDQLIADFYLTGYQKNNKDFEVGMFDLHMVAVHSFAKVDVYDGDSIALQWFDPDWLEKNIENNKIRIHHENNGEQILLTAQPKELQKFVKKYLHSEEAFKDGMDVKLYKINND